MHSHIGCIWKIFLQEFSEFLKKMCSLWWRIGNCLIRFSCSYSKRISLSLNFPKKCKMATNLTRWIFQNGCAWNWYMDFFLAIWICLSSFMDLSMLLYFFLPFSKQNQAELWPRFQSFLKLLLWTKVVEWVKVLNALGPMCLLQCFFFYI